MRSIKFKIKYLILGGLLILLIVARIMAPTIILSKTNDYLSSFSENYTGHVGDFDLSLWRGAYFFKNIELALKTDATKPFATVKVVEVSIAWSQIFYGRIVTDVIANEVVIVVDRAFTTVKKNKSKSAEDAKNVKSKFFPVTTEKIEIRNSRIEDLELNLFADQIEGRLSHVTATPENPLSILTLRGLLLGKTPLKIASTLNLTEDPVAWVFAAEVQKLNLVDTNFFTKRYIPITFKSGILDIFSEIKSENGKISGYVKPFLKDGVIFGDDKDFESIKHFGIELTVAALNLFFRSNNKHVVATRVLFTYNEGQFEWNQSEAFTELFKNGYQQQLNPGLENLLTLSKKSYKDGTNK